MKHNIFSVVSIFTKRHRLVILSGVFCIGVDQLLKYLAHTFPENTLYIIPHFIGWEYFANPGIAFSIPIPQFIVIPLSTAIIIGGILFLRKKPQNNYHIFGAALLIAGALSNLIDRSIFGFTIDYIRIVTSIFNLADLAIITGSILLLQGTKNKKSIS